MTKDNEKPSATENRSTSVNTGGRTHDSAKDKKKNDDIDDEDLSSGELKSHSELMVSQSDRIHY